jgi:hypothetical protein
MLVVVSIPKGRDQFTNSFPFECGESCGPGNITHEKTGRRSPPKLPISSYRHSVVTQNPSRTLRTTNLHPIIEEPVDIREMSREDIAEIRSRLAILGRTSRRRFPGAGLRDSNQSFITKH